MKLYYASGSAEREARGDDSYRTEVWDGLELVGEVEDVGGALALADDTGRGVYYLADEVGYITGSICSIHAAHFGDRVRYYQMAS